MGVSFDQCFFLTYQKSQRNHLIVVFTRDDVIDVALLDDLVQHEVIFRVFLALNARNLKQIWIREIDKHIWSLDKAIIYGEGPT